MKPATIFSVVVLPQPEGPRMVRIALADRHRDIVDDRDPRIGLGDTDEAQIVRLVLQIGRTVRQECPWIGRCPYASAGCGPMPDDRERARCAFGIDRRPASRCSENRVRT